MTIPRHIKEEIINLIPYVDFNEFKDFTALQFKELTIMGVFLNDVKFTELTLPARRKVIFSASRLWIMAKKSERIGILIGKELW